MFGDMYDTLIFEIEETINDIDNKKYKINDDLNNIHLISNEHINDIDNKKS